LALRFCEDLPQSQIAQRLGISQVHVSRLLSATLERLRQSFWDDAAMR
jgi:RNA polymerase sigma-B factor